MPKNAAGPTSLHKVVTVIDYEAGWFACVLGAAYHHPWIGPAVVALLVAFDLAVATDPARELAFLGTAGALGFAIDTAQSALGAFTFTGQSTYPWLCPPWMAALWVIFGTLFQSPLLWLRGRYGLGAVLGGLGGPLAYYAGARLGPITLSAAPVVGLGIVAVAWATATPLLLWLSARIVPRSPQVDLVS